MYTAREFERLQKSGNVQKVMENKAAIIVFHKGLGFYEAIEKKERSMRNSVYPSSHRSMKGSFKEAKREFDRYSA